MQKYIDEHHMRRYRKYGNVFLRIALGVAFLVLVADRLGMLGPTGAPSSLASWIGTPSWGTFHNFESYTGQVLSFAPQELVPTAAVLSTIAEAAFGLTLFLGLFTRCAALGTGLLLLVYGTSMAISFGVESPLSYSVYAASAGAFVLATGEAYAWSLDALLARSRSDAKRSLPAGDRAGPSGGSSDERTGASAVRAERD